MSEIRIESKQWLEAAVLIAGMAVITVLALLGETDGMMAALLIEGILLGNEGISTGRIVAVSKKPKENGEAIKKIESRQIVEVVVLLIGMGLLCLLAWQSKTTGVTGDYVITLIEIIILAFCGVAGGRIYADRKGLLNANAVLRTAGDFFTGSGDNSEDISDKTILTKYVSKDALDSMEKDGQQ